MSMDHSPRPDNPEGIGPSIENLRSNCADATTAGLEDLLTNFPECITLQEASEVANFAANVARHAEATHDVEEITQCIDVMERLPENSAIAKLSVYMAGARMGNERATHLAMNLVAEEKADNMDGSAPAFRLEHAARELTRYRIPANAWIDEFAVDATHHYELMLSHDYAMSCGYKDDEDSLVSEVYQAQYESNVRKLLTGEFPDEFVATQTARHFDRIQDVDLRRQLVTHHLDMVSRADRISRNLLYAHVKLACGVAQDAEVATPENIAAFEMTIGAWIPAFKEVGEDVYTMEMLRGPWELSLQVHRAATPQQLIESVDKQVGRLLNADIPESAESEKVVLRNKDYVARVRDDYLLALAKDAVGSGDFDTAQIFMNEVSDIAREALLSWAVGKAMTADDLAKITPDEFTLQFNPTLELSVRAAEAYVAGDRQQLLALGHEIATGQETTEVKWDLLERIYKYLDRDAEAAKEFVQLLRDQTDMGAVEENLSKAAIAAGDSNEANTVHNEIMQDPRYFSQLSRLARLINDIDGI
jgi:tryptophan 2,3-dioxygenase